MERTSWVIQWSTPLLPDLEWIPGDEIFQERTKGCSLVSDFGETSGSRCVSSDALPGSVKKTRKRGKQKETRRRRIKGSI